MLAGIIQTIIMALGIATGNISSNAYKGGNVFNEVEQSQKAPIKKAEDNINKNYTYALVQTYNNSSKKWYLSESVELYASPHINNGYYSIYNTSYFINKDVGNGWNALLITILKINTYYNFGQTTLTITQDLSSYNGTSNTLQYYVNKNNFRTNQDIDSWIDMTLNDTTIAQLEEYRSLITRQNEVYETTYLTSTSANYESNNVVNTYQLSDLMPTSTYYVVMVYNFIILGSGYRGASGEVTPNAMNLVSTAVVPTVNYEIVDIPGLMFTIVSLPFSFISTAFNLTMFPGTPYQINFANLFMVVLAAFILMWIIKKVFH